MKLLSLSVVLAVLLTSFAPSSIEFVEKSPQTNSDLTRWIFNLKQKFDGLKWIFIELEDLQISMNSMIRGLVIETKSYQLGKCEFTDSD